MNHQADFQLSLKFTGFPFLLANLLVTGNEKAEVVFSSHTEILYEGILDSRSTRRLLDVIEPALRTYGTDPAWSEGGLDGVDIRGSFQSSTFTVQDLSFWSPVPGTPPHNLVSAALDCVRLDHVDPACKAELEELREMLEVGLRIRLLSFADRLFIDVKGSPLQRGISADVKSALSKLPATGDLTVDLLQFSPSDCPRLEELRPLAQRTPPATWIIAHDKQLEWLKLLAVDPKCIVKRTSGDCN